MKPEITIEDVKQEIKSHKAKYGKTIQKAKGVKEIKSTVNVRKLK